MAPEVYDMQGQRRDWAWLRQKYGNVNYLDAGDVDKFALVRVDETTGPAVLKATVLNESGGPHAKQPVANHWPDNSLPDLTQAGLMRLWQSRAIHQYTDGNGITGFGLGGGSYIKDLIAGGPHTVWVLSPSIDSDGMSGIGMLGGTNHDGPLSLTFQVMRNGTPEPGPDPDPEPVADIDRLIALAVPMMDGAREPKEIADRAKAVFKWITDNEN